MKHSQNNEEQIIINAINKLGLTKGRLLDIGAFDGIMFSNTRAVMLNYPEWSGVFVEPSSYCFSKLIELYKSEPRRAELVNMAIVSEEEIKNSSVLKFFDSPLSTVSSSIEGHTNRWYEEKNSDGDVINPRRVFVGKMGMRELLESFGPFDFMSIDVEGYSAKLVLQDWFNPNDYGCRILCVEHDGFWREIQQKFAILGYQTIGINPENIIVVKT